MCGITRRPQANPLDMVHLSPDERPGRSETASYYGIASRQEAEAYLAHPVLGPRLRECTRLVNLVEGRTVDQIFGYPDNLEFRSSMTLFAATASDNQIFKDALEKYFAGEPDPLTIELL